MNVTTTSTPLERALFDEWNSRLADATETYGCLGTLTGEQLLEVIRRPQELDERDHVLIELLELDRAGHPTAGRILLQSFLPLAFRQARTSAATRDLWRHSPTDATATTISALWEVIHTYPLHRRHSVAGNIRLEAVKLLATTLGAHVDKEVTVEAGFLEHLVNLNADPDATEDAFKDLVTLFTWAIESHTLTRDEVRLLARIELAEGDPGEAREDAAHELGLSRETLNKRVYRIRTKLMTAICGEVQVKVGYAPRRTA